VAIWLRGIKMIEFYVSEDELRKALEALQEAKERGFVSSQAIFELKRVGGDLKSVVDQDNAVFKEQVILKEHPHDPGKNWGRISVESMTYYRLDNGRFVEGKPEK